MNEEWRDIEEFKGMFQISDMGRVRALKGKKPFHIYRSFVSNAGYYRLNLKIGKKNNNRNIHRLIALTFIPNPENKPVVNHIDGDKLNNSLENLEWLTRSENCRHAFKTGLSGGPNKSNYELERIMTIRTFFKNNKQKFNDKVAKAFGMPKETVSAIRRGKSNSQYPVCSLDKIAKEKEACTWKDEFYE